MTDLPRGWSLVTLNEAMAECRNGLTYRNNPELAGFPVSRIETISKGEIDFEKVGYGGISLDGNQKHLLNPGDILFSHINSMLHVGKVAIYRNGMPALLHGMNLLRITPNDDFMPEFLFYLFQSSDVRKQIWSKAKHAVNQASINIGELKTVVIPKPPFEEQHKIVEILEDHLSRLDAALADVKQAKLKAAQFRRSFLESIFSGKLEDGSHMWPLTTVGEVSAKPQYGWTTSASTSGEVKLLRTTDLTRGPLNWETVPYCEALPSDITKYLLAPGDILISRTGVGVGTSGLIESVPEESVFASYLIRIRPINTLKPKFLSYFLQSPEYWKQIGFLKAGSAISNINVPKIQSIKIPFPSLQIQEKVIDYVEIRLIELNHFSKVIDEAENKAIGLRRSLLQAAFTGQLTKEVVSV